MARAGRWMRTLLAYGMPAYLVMVLTIAVQGAFAPWPSAREVLARHEGQVPIMVGVVAKATRTPDRGLQTTKARYYVLVPGVLGDPKLLRVTQVDGGAVHESSTHVGFWILLGALIACSVGTWWFWLRTPSAHGDGATSES